MKHKKIYAALIAVALMFSILPFGAFAAPTEYKLYVGGVQFTSSNLTINKSDLNSGVTSGQATYDPSKNTLTLDNITVKNAVGEFTVSMDGSEAQSYSALTYNGTAPLTIVLKGTNTIKAKSASALALLVMFNTAVRADLAAVTIKSEDGKGVLVADGSEAYTFTGLGYGLYVGSTLTIDNCTVEAIGPLTETTSLNPIASYGISAGRGIIINNSKVTATGGRSTKTKNTLMDLGVSADEAMTLSFGMFCEEKGIDITNSTVTVKSGVGDLGAAIVSADGVNVKNSTLKTSGTDGATMQFGVMADGRISIDNSTVEVKAADSPDAKNVTPKKDVFISSIGMVSIGEFSIKNGSKVTAAAGKSEASIGLCASDDDNGIIKGHITISDSQVTVSGETTAVNIKPVTKSFATDYTESVSEKADGSAAVKWTADFDKIPDKILGYKFYKVEPGIIDINCPSAKFTDVPKDIWYHASVDFVVERGYMSGTSGTTFAPDTPVSRAMLTQLLNNMEGNPKPKENNHFTDVAEGAWYANAVNWAYEQGLVSGVGNGKFNPNASITRQEMTVLLYNYAKWKGLDVSATKDISHFSDYSKISSWALKSFQWANAEGIVSGNTDGTLNPLGSASRAQIATLIRNFITKYGL